MQASVRYSDFVFAAGAKRKLGFLVLLYLLVLYVCLFSHLGAIGLVGPDEPRYAEVAREMADNGDWVTPRLYGQPWFEKPVLYYWCAALAFRAFGVSEFAARLPAALAAVLAALALAWVAFLAWYREGAATAHAVLLIFPTSVAAIGFARSAGPDMLITAALTAAMVAAWVILLRGHDAGRGGLVHLFGFGVFLGLGTLAKGPAAVVLAGGSALLWALGTRRWRDVFRLAHPLAVTAFCVTALPWYMLCAARNPDFLRIFLQQHNLQRYLTPVFHHQQPFWFYVPVLLVALLPWTVLLIPSVRDAWRLCRVRRWVESPEFYFACWVIFPLLFFSLSQPKRPGYILPAIPALTLLLSRSATGLIQQARRPSRVIFFALGATLIVLGLAGALWPHRLLAIQDPLFHRRILLLAAAAVGGGFLVALCAVLWRPSSALVVSALLVTLLVYAVGGHALPRLDPAVSARDAAARVPEAGAAARNTVFIFRLHRAWHYGLNFYLRSELREWTPQAARPAFLYTNTAGLAELQQLGLRVSLLSGRSPQAILVRVEP